MACRAFPSATSFSAHSTRPVSMADTTSDVSPEVWRCTAAAKSASSRTTTRTPSTRVVPVAVSCCWKSRSQVPSLRALNMKEVFPSFTVRVLKVMLSVCRSANPRNR